MIDIIIPVLNRPQNAAKVVDSILLASTELPIITFVCSPGDREQIAAVELTEQDYIITDWAPGNGDGAKKWNLGYTHTERPFVFLAADDLEFERGWDERVLEVAQKSVSGVTGTNDDANPLVKRGLHSTHSLVSRRYIDEVGGTWHDGPGVCYHEGYLHQWVDTELVGAAKQRGEWAFARRSVVRHLHPLYPQRGGVRTQMDDTYRKALEGAREDMMLFKERQRRAIVTR